MQPLNDQEFRNLNNAARAAKSLPNKPNKAELIREAVAHVIDQQDERPDDKTISMLREAASLAINGFEIEYHLLLDKQS